MDERGATGILLAIVIGMTGCGPKVETPPPPQITATETQDSPEHLEQAATVQVTAAVTHVDHAKRLVTLKDSTGAEQTIAIGPEVRNLEQVQRGDEVIVTYYEAVVFDLLPPGSGEPGIGVAEGADRAEVGQKPGAVEAEAVAVTATVQAVDRSAPSITLKGPEGNVVTLPVRDASRLDPVKVGDLLRVTYKRALAVAVEKP